MGYVSLPEGNHQDYYMFIYTCLVENSYEPSLVPSFWEGGLVPKVLHGQIIMTPAEVTTKCGLSRGIPPKKLQ